ncbi:hypothetical protein [Lysinibacter sp. HNR]|uniref:hypothetical protein n=1 Tax=Lysinibacter sp. HNR TaxID=3031408 RepID=UPI002435203A|nr:hypothetical protein [Lysinibacter sp. HNR]WGD38501.1 hypothetical protein FrondiHNR_06210 [Lysinibacter sp. HNR]
MRWSVGLMVAAVFVAGAVVARGSGVFDGLSLVGVVLVFGSWVAHRGEESA